MSSAEVGCVLTTLSTQIGHIVPCAVQRSHSDEAGAN